MAIERVGPEAIIAADWAFDSKIVDALERRHCCEICAEILIPATFLRKGRK
jgi:hypothetical protein